MTKTKTLWALVLLAGCTAVHPPSYNLPSARSIVAGGNYTVKRNENVYAIAQKNKVNMREIIVLNKLQPPFALRPGQVLILPAKDGAAPTPQAAPLAHIDKGYMAPPSNGHGGSAGLGAVQQESLPPLSAATPSAPSTATTRWIKTPEATVKSEAQSAVSEPLPIVAKPVQEAVKTTPVAAAEAVQEKAEAVAKVDPNATPVFGWPVRGTIISAFGPKGRGLDNDGINISAPKGTPVKAAEGGMVAYAGSEMKGFGNLVLIKHPKGWVTAYAHLDRLVVAKDSIVAKGDMIGTVGTSGGVSSPQLHFETRLEGKPVDPELMIK
ncbi:MAG: peptidoglycan DD-metalloendopeptidase family protein [Bdellovibrionales bacterium]